MVWSTLEAQSHSLYEKLHNVHIEYFDFWKNNILFTWRWWRAVSLVVLPWTIWLLVRKKELFGLYRRTYWEHYCSIPIMIYIYLVANYLASNNKFAKLK